MKTCFSDYVSSLLDILVVIVDLKQLGLVLPPNSDMIQVSRVTGRAKQAVEAAGGSVRRVHYNKLDLKALLKPVWCEKKGRLLPKPARPPPKEKSIALAVCQPQPSLFHSTLKKRKQRHLLTSLREDNQYFQDEAFII